MTESEALRQFIPILGRISPPGERAIITRNVLERIQGRQTSVMGVSHKHAGALAWPRDTTKAQAFEAAMDAAVDAGEFVSFIHKSDRRHFQIEELASWPGCPAIAPDSPLVFWLGEPDAQQAAPQAAPPAPVTDSASNAPVVTPPPVATGDVAYAFDGLRGWNEKAWKDTLGSPPKWLDACIAIRGQRGVRENHWNPVLIGAALVHNGHAKQNSIRARFQTKTQLKDWLEAWKTYEADNFDTQ